MRVKKILTALLLSVILVVSTAACSTSTQTVTESSTPSSVVSETQMSNDVSQTGSFDFDEVCKNIVINGKKYTFPFSVEELGEGYSLGDMSYSKLEKDDEYYSAHTNLYYNNMEIADVWFFGITEKEKDDNSINFSTKKIENLNQSSSLNDINEIFIEVDGLKIGDKSENVLNKLGIYSRENLLSDGYGSYIYTDSGNENHMLTFKYIDYTISSIRLSYNNNYKRLQKSEQ